MKLAVRLLIVAGLIALGWWAWTVLFPNPRKEVWHRLEKLAQLASFPANEGQLAKMVSVQKMTGYFSEQVVVNFKVSEPELRTFNNRDDLMQAVQAACMASSSVRAKFHDPNIELTPGNREAIVGVALTADINGEQNTVVEVLKVEMKKVDGDWLITHVEAVQ